MESIARRALVQRSRPEVGRVERPFVVVDVYATYCPPERLLLAVMLYDRQAAIQATQLLGRHRWGNPERADLADLIGAYAATESFWRPGMIGAWLAVYRPQLLVVFRWASTVPIVAVIATLPVENLMAVVDYGDVAFAPVAR